MEYLELRTRPKSKYIEIHPVGDFHFGSSQCDLSLIKEKVEEIRGKNKKGVLAYAVGMGDLTENALCESLGDTYGSADPEDEIDGVVELLSPIKDYLLFILEGNHSQRTRRVAGLRVDRIIAQRLGVHYFGYSAVLSIKVNRVNYVGYFHHLEGGGTTEGAKVNAIQKLVRIFPLADFYVGAHGHLLDVHKNRCYYFDPKGKNFQRLKAKQRTFVLSGSSLNWSESYAEAKLHPPADKGFATIRLWGEDNGHAKHKIEVEF